ncbi:Nitroreductase [Pilibacter termitis]|uniref:Nitroreductase n=1 Tax=Pilibacter termitis TaxID=263852 RepID=A0A1T4NKU0_9ENTE|nr:nitroreductase family protein [Pilibacter termitis]SJZ79879.1 Nitroreductase [Pilibacter termitis]
MNETINLLKNHKSIRKFDLSYTIPETDMKEIFAATRQAATWMNGQFYSMIVVKNKETRRKLYELAPPHMTFIEECNELIVFVGDMHRTSVASEMHDTENLAVGIEPILMASVDASLAAQNMCVAAESLGLGTVVIGMIRPHAVEAAELLGLPEKTFPLFMVALGKPTEEMQVKPRLPEELVVHDETYKEVDVELLKLYDEVEKTFAGERTKYTWTEKFAKYFSRKPHEESTKQLKKAGLLEDE